MHLHVIYYIAYILYYKNYISVKLFTAPFALGACLPVWKSLPYVMKIKHSYETFCKLKWHKVKKQLPLVYTGKIFECSHTQNNNPANHTKHIKSKTTFSKSRNDMLNIQSI